MAAPLPELHRKAPGRGPTIRPEPSAPRGLPLGLVLGPILAAVVCLVLGGLTQLEQRREIRRERDDRQSLLEQSLAPVAEELESASSLAGIHTVLERAEAAYVERGLPGHWLRLDDGDGRQVATARPDGAGDPPRDALVASTEVQNPLLAGGAGVLTATKDASRLTADVRERWRLWWLDLVITSAVLILAVSIAVHLLVGRPLGRLVSALRSMEHGHLGDWDCGPGAWEIRWLAWRFHRLGIELADSVRRLVAAERRALEATRQELVDPGRTAPLPRPVSAPTDGVRVTEESTLAVRYLEDTCRLLEALQPGDPLAEEVAEDAWTVAVVEAERLGDMRLRARLEDGALRLLEPEAYVALVGELAALRRSRAVWVRETSDQLRSVVSDQGVPVADVQHRVKHAAGAWRKMKERHLDLEQVPDLFAFRILVPEETHCYLALAAVHQAFEPEPFRFKDYIAEPKPNGYRSLHTSVRDSAGRVFEVQIRTPEMHENAELGAAAHWRYRARRWSTAPATPRRRWWRRRPGRP